MEIKFKENKLCFIQILPLFHSLIIEVVDALCRLIAKKNQYQFPTIFVLHLKIHIKVINQLLVRLTDTVINYILKQ